RCRREVQLSADRPDRRCGLAHPGNRSSQAMPSDRPADSRRCLGTAATGYVGSRLVPELLARGHAVRAMARTPAKLDGADWRDQFEVAQGYLTEPASLVAAFDGMDVVYYLVHSMGTSQDFVAEERRS